MDSEIFKHYIELTNNSCKQKGGTKEWEDFLLKLIQKHEVVYKKRLELEKQADILNKDYNKKLFEIEKEISQNYKNCPFHEYKNGVCFVCGKIDESETRGYYNG